MGLDAGAIVAREYAEVLALPKIPHAHGSGKADRGPWQRHVHLIATVVEQRDSALAFPGQPFHPDLMADLVLHDRNALHAERVLVDRDDVRIEQDIPDGIGHI